MTPKLLKINKVDFVPAKYSGTNESGYVPIGDRILVAIDKASSVSLGGIEIPQDVEERMTMSAETGVFVAAGDGAFKTNSDGTPFHGRVPKPGERVFIERYAGQILPKAPDGQMYRIMTDKCLGGIATEGTK